MLVYTVRQRYVQKNNFSSNTRGSDEGSVRASAKRQKTQTRDENRHFDLLFESRNMRSITPQAAVRAGTTPVLRITPSHLHTHPRCSLVHACNPFRKLSQSHSRPRIGIRHTIGRLSRPLTTPAPALTSSTIPSQNTTSPPLSIPFHSIPQQLQLQPSQQRPLPK